VYRFGGVVRLGIPIKSRAIVGREDYFSIILEFSRKSVN
jgi:hypothetical protein